MSKQAMERASLFIEMWIFDIVEIIDKTTYRMWERVGYARQVIVFEPWR